MLIKIIIAGGVAIGLALAIPRVVGIVTATVALHEVGINPTNAARVVTQINADALRSAQDLLNDPLTNPNHQTLDDCRNGSTKTPCNLVRSFLKTAERK